MKKTSVTFKLILTYFLILLAGVFFMYLLSTQRIGLRCIFRDLTGFKCPGCGNTNSLISLLSGHPQRIYNLMFYPEAAVLLSVIIYVPYIVITRKKFSKIFGFVLAAAAVIFILWAIIRNFINL